MSFLRFLKVQLMSNYITVFMMRSLKACRRFRAGLLKKAAFFLVSVPVLVLALCNAPVFSQKTCTEDGDAGLRITDCSDCRVPDRGMACLHVVIKGIKEDSGVVRMSLYDREDTYNAREHSCRFAVMKVKNCRAGEIFNNLKPGWYAILLFHDANDNHEFDRVMGIPVERFGFSNNVRAGITGAPGFEEARFKLEPDQCVTHVISLQSLFSS